MIMQTTTCRPEKTDEKYWSEDYRYKAEITPSLIATCRQLRKNGLTVGDIANEIKWPQHKSLRMIRQWIR